MAQTNVIGQIMILPHIAASSASKLYCPVGRNINQYNIPVPPQLTITHIAVVSITRRIRQRTFRISIRFYLKDIYSSTNSQKYSSTNQWNQKGNNYKFFEISGMNREK